MLDGSREDEVVERSGIRYIRAGGWEWRQKVDWENMQIHARSWGRVRGYPGYHDFQNSSGAVLRMQPAESGVTIRYGGRDLENTFTAKDINGLIRFLKSRQSSTPIPASMVAIILKAGYVCCKFPDDYPEFDMDAEVARQAREMVNFRGRGAFTLRDAAPNPEHRGTCCSLM